MGLLEYRELCLKPSALRAALFLPVATGWGEQCVFFDVVIWVPLSNNLLNMTGVAAKSKNLVFDLPLLSVFIIFAHNYFAHRVRT